MQSKENRPYIAVGAFIDETIKELSKVNSDEKVSEFLIGIAEKVKLGMYRKKNQFDLIFPISLSIS